MDGTDQRNKDKEAWKRQEDIAINSPDVRADRIMESKTPKKRKICEERPERARES